MNKTTLISAIAIVVALGGVFFLGGDSKDSQKNARDTKVDTSTEKEEVSFDKAPSFTLKDWNGNEVKLSDFKGTPVILNAWAVWCPFCLDELPDFAELQDELGDSVVVIAIDRAEPTAKQKEFTDKLGVTDRLLFLNDEKDSFYQSIGGFSMPETLFVDKDGNIRSHKRGPMNIEEMRKRTQSIL